MTIAIVGAGCSGLSLAYHLVERGFDGRELVLIDPRTEYRRDRTWCFFDVVPHPFADLVTHRWPRWRVRAKEREWVERSAPGLSYQHLPSDAFYDRVLDRLRQAGVELRLGTSVGLIDAGPDEAVVHTSAGPLAASIVFDSRPANLGATPGEISFVQHFEGWVVELERPAFDPSLATLMDFAVPQTHGVHFFYVLPFDERSALVEATWFGIRPVDPAMYREALEGYLAPYGAYRIEHTERGAIPMTTAALPRRSGRRVYHIGLGGGMAKPSTGYAFQAIQTYSAEMARRLERDPLPNPPAPRPWQSRIQDRLFLRYLDRHTLDAPATLVRLFEQVDPTNLARFLADRATVSEGVEIMSAMPMLTMSLEMLRAPSIWLDG